MTQQRATLLFIFVLTLCLISPTLLSHGMFMDGLIYSCVALNLHEGLGDFWHLSFTSTLYHQFHEHPPLAMWLQSLWMDVCGNAFWTDRLYSVMTIFIQGILLVTITKQVKSPFQTIGYWALLFFLLNPLTLWMLPNNLLENTMGIFTLLSIFIAYRSYKKNGIWHAFASGMMITAAVYVKGPVGLFPFSFFVIFGIFGDPHFPFWASVRYFLIQLAGFSLLFLLPILTIDSAQTSWIAYWDRQVVNSIQNVATVSHRFYVLQQMILHMLPMVVLTLGYYFLLRKKNISLTLSKRSEWLPWLLLGLSGIIPMMISLKQREFYILPALPYVILSFCILMQTSFLHLHKKWTESISIRRLTSITLLLASLCLTISLIQLNKNHRNDTLQQDLKMISSLVSDGSTMGISHCLVEDWSLYGYAYRYYHWSLIESNDLSFLISKQKDCQPPEPQYLQTNLYTHQLNLYQNTNSTTPRVSPKP